VRKIVGAVLIGIGGFLLVAAIVAVTWVPGQVQRTPIEIDTTTELEGQVATLDTETQELSETRDVYALSITKSDTEASTDDTVVFTTNTCLNEDLGQPRECYSPAEEDFVVTVSPTDVAATDRSTALAVPTDLEPVEHEGLINKWPFDAEQETYPYWDSTAQVAVDAVFDRTEEIEGLETNVYRIEVQDAPVLVSGLSEEIDGTYDDVKEIYVDPRTGAIVNQTEQQQRFFDDGTQALDLELAFTDEQVATNVADAQDNASSLDLLMRTVPLIGVIGGPLLLLGGLVLLLVGGRNRSATHSGRDSRPMAGAGV
jgi:hypothetical protein